MTNVYEIIRNYFFPECTACNNRNCVKFFGRLFTCNESKIGFISDWTRPLQIEPWPELGKEKLMMITNRWWNETGVRYGESEMKPQYCQFRDLRFLAVCMEGDFRSKFGHKSYLVKNGLYQLNSVSTRNGFYTARPIPIRFLLVLSLFSW